MYRNVQTHFCLSSCSEENSILAISAAELIKRLEEVTGHSYSIDQKEAISHSQGPLWVTAGPGSGKTEVLVARTLKLMICDEIQPASIMLTTFTERAAKSLLDRISSYINDFGFKDSFDVTGLKTGTLHSLCNSIMRDFRYGEYIDLELLDQESNLFFLYNQDKILDYFKRNWQQYEPLFAGQRVSHTYGPNKWAAASVANFIFDRITEFRVDVDKMATSSNIAARGLAEIYKIYRKTLLDSYRSNLSILQEYFLRFLYTPQGKEFLSGDKRRGIPAVKHLLVDEFQDTNPIQEEIYFAISKAIDGNITVVGDDDQALYRFRGGTVDSLVNFGARSMLELRQEPKKVNLHENLRSHPAIVQWINKYISREPVMQQPGARAPGKRDMVAKSSVKGNYPAVCMISGPKVDDASDKLAEFLFSLMDRKMITDWKDVGVLFKSTRESPRNAGPYVNALRARGIPVYNPRSRALGEDEIVQQLLGTLVMTLDRNLLAYEAVSGRVKAFVTDWMNAYQSLVATNEGKEIAKYVKNSHSYMDHLAKSETLNTTVMDVLYRILSLPPFGTIKNDPNYSKRFAQITDLLDAFSAFTQQYGVLRASSTGSKSISFEFLQSLYRQFSGFIEANGLNEPEDEENIMPSGMVQVMTVHQAKGLQFPVVVVANLNDTPRVGSEHWTEDFLSQWSRHRPRGTAQTRAEQDLVRRYYVAYSRAKNLLILCCRSGSNNKWTLGEWDGY